MDIDLYVTRSDFNLANIKQELNQLRLSYRAHYVEEHPEFLERYGVRHSPSIVIDGELAFQSQPSEEELLSYIHRRSVIH